MVSAYLRKRDAAPRQGSAPINVCVQKELEGLCSLSGRGCWEEESVVVFRTDQIASLSKRADKVGQVPPAKMAPTILSLGQE